MKWIRWILLGLLSFVVLTVAGIYAAGLREGANQMVSRVEVNKPVAVVWEHFNDPVKTTQWVSWLKEIKSLTPGNKGVGSKELWIMEDRNNNNERMEVLGEATAIEPLHKIEVKLSAANAFTGNATYLFEDLGGGRTAVTSISSYRFDNGFARFMTPVVLHFAKEKMGGDLQHFKANVEKE